MNYYVLKDEKKYDSIGNEDKGLYRHYVVEVEPFDKNNLCNCYISHTEMFCRETNCWENIRNRRIDEIDKSKYRLVKESECSCSNYLTFYQQIDFKDKE